MKVSFTTLGCPDWTLEKIVAGARNYRYDGVELRVSSDGNHLSPDASDADLHRAAAIFKHAGVKVMSVMGYTRFAFTDPKDVAANQQLMRKQFRVAKALGAPYIRSFAGQIPKGTNKDAMTDVVADAIAPLAKEAAKLGVTIGLETHDDWCAGERVMRVVKRVKSRAFGVVYDIHNAFHSGLEPWHVTYEKVKRNIVYCHLKDGYRGTDGNLHYVYLGAGELPIRDLLRRFKRDGYRGFFSFEWEKKWHSELEPPEQAFPQFPPKVRALWKEA